MKRYIRASESTNNLFSLGRRRDQIYVIELNTGERILVTMGPNNVYGLDYYGDHLVGCYNRTDNYSNATDNFIANWPIYDDIKRVTPYHSEYDALEGECGVPVEYIHIECPRDNQYVENNNILTPDGTRDYNLFVDYSFDDIVKLVRDADKSPEHIAENINHGFGHYKMICTISE